MLKNILGHIEKAIVKFSADKYLSDILKAKDQYIALTGKIDEDAADYEAQMNAFNAWYLFLYEIKKGNTPMNMYVSNIEDAVAQELLTNFTFSIFEYKGTNFRGRMVLRNLIDGTKVVLIKNHERVAMIEGDIIAGYVFHHGEDNYLNPVFTLIEKNALAAIKKQIKNLKKDNAGSEQFLQFIYDTIHLTNRYRNYSHVEAKKFFKY